MINGKKVLALIPARSGSKGLPGKNIKRFCGKPLIRWSVEQAKQSSCVDQVIVSTDDPTIASASGFEAQFLQRPKELAGDKTPMMGVVENAVRAFPGYDILVLLQPTSPLRLPGDIDACLQKVADTGSACVSVSEPRHHPCIMFYLKDGTLLVENYVDQLRQTMPKIYCLNGAVYAAQIPWLLKKYSFVTESTHAHIMPEDRSVDIDTITDFILAEFLMKQRLEAWATLSA